MSTYPDDANEEPIGTFMTPNEQQPCPVCKPGQRMKFIFPSVRSDPCEELNAWRFQRCPFCGWTGDVATGKFYSLTTTKNYLIANGKIYGNGLRGLLEELELCP